ncbi:DUF3991 and toprim domain-containing protein [Streptobacillus moniliformis]|uniref:DUF3991 and toprim domain-containing protein n=1 Tax=Streptobacillus moniliformis TaxID=34105 RepID=UPI0007E2F684|nr:DUF3991 and toprim domain-containing protein [Streptobacillus moniliformis]
MIEVNTNRNNINLKDLLEFMGEDVIPHGRKNFKLRNHDSLILNGNRFYWNSKNIGGNYYILLKELYGFNNKKAWEVSQEFLDAIEYGEFIPGKIETINEKKEYEYKHYEKKGSLDDIKKYLCDKRCLDSQIVESLYYNKLLYMDYKKNIIFSIKDINDGEKIGEEIIGTGELKYRRNTSESKGFNLTRRSIEENPEINTLYVFESTIDLLSYVQLYKTEINDKWQDINVRFLTLSGLREDIFKQYIENIENVYVCVDNDVAGENFYEKVKGKYEGINFYREKPIEKDFNEDLSIRNRWTKKDKKKEEMER